MEHESIFFGRRCSGSIPLPAPLERFSNRQAAPDFHPLRSGWVLDLRDESARIPAKSRSLFDEKSENGFLLAGIECQDPLPCADRNRKHNSVRRRFDRHCWTLLARSIARARRGHSPPRRGGVAAPSGAKAQTGWSDRRNVSAELTTRTL